MDPATNIRFGVRYVKYQQSRYPNTTDAIAAYNAGSVFKDAQGFCTKSGGSRGVQQYVDAVMGYYQGYLIAAGISGNTPVPDILRDQPATDTPSEDLGGEAPPDTTGTIMDEAGSWGFPEVGLPDLGLGGWSLLLVAGVLGLAVWG